MQAFVRLSLVFCVASLLSLSVLAQLTCNPDAKYRIAESIPLGMNIVPQDLYTWEAWKDVIDGAKETLDIGCFYFTLTGGYREWPPAYGGIIGFDMFESIIAAHQRGVKVRIVQLTPSADFPDNDSLTLAREGIAEVRNINWEQLVGAGILHTKVMISDTKNLYLGSANMDWRSLTQVKELGIGVTDCPLIANDAQKAFETYWLAANMTSLPKQWPAALDTKYNAEHPATAVINGTQTQLFIATAPPEFTTPHRTADIDAIVDAMNSAEKSISIEVMDYCPCTLYNQVNSYWGIIDDAIRAAAFRGVHVRFLTAHWAHTYNETIQYFKSLDDLANVEVRMFVVPPQPGEKPAPFTRVNHAKFMVTDKQTYVGTSNWSADYFINTGGMSYNWFSDPLRDKIQAVFDRDWNSEYAHACCM